ncbi:MAG: hypothetical protein KC431_12475, partial [Myxococcales bacterium]|nr:hypothetical protein [Myxococcales bacterium]
MRTGDGLHGDPEATLAAEEATLPPEDSPSASDGDAPPRLAHYLLLDKLGAGAMGVVHAAFDTRLDRKVAIKLLRTGGSEQAQLRLLREAQAMAR